MPYGNALGGDPTYGFPQITNNGVPLYPDLAAQNLVGFAAKGNVIVGDYTSANFQSQVVPAINGTALAKTKPYAIDPTDAALGYHTGNGGVMYDADGLPLFDGNYNQQDMSGLSPGVKLDGTARKFYESSFSDARFRSLLSMPANGAQLNIRGVIFTNHAVAGFTSGSAQVVGAVVARDDAFVFNGGRLEIDHDRRLIGSGASSRQIALPYEMKRPVLSSWKECILPADCPAP